MSTFNNLLLMGAEATAESGGGGGGGGDPFSPSLVTGSVWQEDTSDFFSKTFSSGAVQSRVIVSTWIQRCALGTEQAILASLGGAGGSTASNRLTITAADKLKVHTESGVSTTTQYESDRILKDIGWYHILLSIDGTASGSDTVKIFVNGDEVALTKIFGSDFTGSLNSWGTSGALHFIGKYNNAITDLFPWKGYFSQYTFLVGRSIQSGSATISDFLGTHTFGTNGSQVIPQSDANVALLASNAGGNSFSLDFSNSSSLGNDASSNNNDFTPTGMSSANATGNTPSKMYATMNMLISGDAGTVTFAEGNRRVTGTAGGDSGTFSTLPLATTGTTEFQMTTNNGEGRVGICCYENCLAAAALPSNNTFGGSAVGFNAAYSYDEPGTLRQRTQSTQTTTAFGLPWSSGDVITVRYNATANELNFLLNNSAQGTTVSTEPGITYYAAVARFNNYDCTFHFDEADFPHTIGSGNKTINTEDLATPSFQGKDFFDATLYTGNSATQTVGGGSDSKFTASAWIKSRSATSSHMLYDRVRGVARDLHSNAADAEVFDGDTLTSFLQRGGELGADSQVNLNAGTFVLWQWLAGSSATGGVTNSTGSTNSTLVTSAAQNFSVGTFTGTGTFTNVGHSLGDVPDAIFVKNATTGSTDWAVYIKNVTGINGNPENNFLGLNTTTPVTASSTAWASQAPTSTVFFVGAGNNQTNQSGATMSFMAFRSIPGVCKVGSYTGNGTTNGPWVNFEFKPRWVLIRRADSGGLPWCVIDMARNPFNTTTDPLVLRPNATDIDTSGTLGDVDFLSNGIKFNSITSIGNGLLGNYVYIAMADIGGHGTLPPIYGI